jgi:hypothetical protein
MDSRQQIALVIINEFLQVFDKTTIEELKQLPKIEKVLFEKNKNELEVIIEKHMNKLRQMYKPNEISLHDRRRLKNYPYTLFKRLYHVNGVVLKVSRQNKLIDKNVQGIMSFCYVA